MPVPEKQGQNTGRAVHFKK